MATFGKGEKEVAGQGTVIGSNVKLVGALRDANDIVVYGTIEGEVASEKSVTIGETAEVKGPVNGDTVSIAGTVNGSIAAETRLEILSSGKVFGNVVVGDLVIHSGAVFTGECKMETRQAATTSSTKSREMTEEPKAKQEYEVE